MGPWKATRLICFIQQFVWFTLASPNPTSEDSSPVEGAVFTGMARFESSCSNPKECYDIYRFGGCVSSASGWLPTDQTYWGVVSADNATPSVRWENQAPSPVPFAAHTVVGKDQDHALVLGGLTSCGEDAAHQNFLWQWRRTDGSWDQLTPIPEPCGLAFHTAHYFRDQGREGMTNIHTQSTRKNQTHDVFLSYDRYLTFD